MKVTEIKPLNVAIDGMKSVRLFLAGSIEMGKAIEWQKEIVSYLKRAKFKNKKINEIIVCNPRRDNWDSSWKQEAKNPEFSKQVEWELENIEDSDIVAFFLQPGTSSPISLLELGIVARDCFRMVNRVVVLCPDGFHRKGNVDITAMMYDMNIAKNMKDFKLKIKSCIEDYNPKKTTKLT